MQHRPDPRKQAVAARHLSKHIFPRQYNLPSSFDDSLNGHCSIEYNDREAQIKARGNCKTPKRLKPALDLLDKLIWRHSKCGYKPLLQRLCPSKVRFLEASWSLAIVFMMGDLDWGQSQVLAR
ncbi:hypothetical protein BC835DRAFT_1281564 [Cytidiella melzeri]|nr:hypothetical protein BC835DRAFT_1281564 [Cytidiella melzeri]